MWRRRCSHRLAQVWPCGGAGVEKGGQPAPLESVSARFAAQVPTQKSHLRQRSGRPAPKAIDACATNHNRYLENIGSKEPRPSSDGPAEAVSEERFRSEATQGVWGIRPPVSETEVIPTEIGTAFAVPISVGVPRLERGTPCSQSRCASQLRHTPMQAQR